MTMASQGRGRCPNDNGLIPEVGVCRESPARVVRFCWCPYCLELSAFLEGSEGKRRLVARFARDENTRGWRIFKAYGADEEVQFAEAAIPQLGRWRDNPPK
jgi:hypothetical protein